MLSPMSFCLLDGIDVLLWEDKTHANICSKCGGIMLDLESPFKCGDCKASFKRIEELSEHLKIHYPDSKEQDITALNEALDAVRRLVVK